MYKKRIYIYFFSLLLLATPMQSCSSAYKAARAQKKAEKAEQKRKEESDKIMEQARQRHMSMQDRSTRQRMKATKKRSDNLINANNRRQKPFFLVRWYRAIVDKF